MEIFNGYKSYFEFQLFYHNVIAKSFLSVELYCRGIHGKNGKCETHPLPNLSVYFIKFLAPYTGKQTNSIKMQCIESQYLISNMAKLKRL